MAHRGSHETADSTHDSIDIPDFPGIGQEDQAIYKKFAQDLFDASMQKNAERSFALGSIARQNMSNFANAMAARLRMDVIEVVDAMDPRIQDLLLHFRQRTDEIMKSKTDVSKPFPGASKMKVGEGGNGSRMVRAK